MLSMVVRDALRVGHPENLAADRPRGDRVPRPIVEDGPKWSAVPNRENRDHVPGLALVTREWGPRPASRQAVEASNGAGDQVLILSGRTVSRRPRRQEEMALRHLST